MKSCVIFFGILTLISSSAFSFQEGSYECLSKDSAVKAEYKVVSLSQGGVSMPYLEIIRTFYGNKQTEDKVFTLKGVASVHTDNTGQESLILEAVSLALDSDGVPACTKK